MRRALIIVADIFEATAFILHCMTLEAVTCMVMNITNDNSSLDMKNALATAKTLLFDCQAHTSDPGTCSVWARMGKICGFVAD